MTIIHKFKGEALCFQCFSVLTVVNNNTDVYHFIYCRNEETCLHITDVGAIFTNGKDCKELDLYEFVKFVVDCEYSRLK